MKALRTKSGQWLKFKDSRYGIDTEPTVYNDIEPEDMVTFLMWAEKEIGEPCEWKDITGISVHGESVVVGVQEAIPVNIVNELYKDLYNDCDHPNLYSYDRGWRDCMRHYGFLKEGGQK